ncbi:MAG: radical SAM protein [Ignavibacteria bacterium]|nr:radical SAM protein [Ignavibacteria bacterium]
MDKPLFQPSDLYRMPWTLPDNGISWLEPTSKCNLSCYGCYRKNVSAHKTLEQVKHEIDVVQRLRKTDCISIAGGDPLLYPHIIEMVAEIKSRGIKPIINTNGIALTKELLAELKKAGVYGFTFHVDSKQKREGWIGKTELELNELRYKFAKMLADEGGIACSFNATVYADTMKYIPEMVKWAQNNIDIVNTIVFILFRYVTPGIGYDFYAGAKKIVNEDIHYHSDKDEITNIMAPDIVNLIRTTEPEFFPAAFLNGTHKADSYKWLLTERMGTKDRIFTYLDSKFMELIMAGYHYLYGTYLSYGSANSVNKGRTTMALLWPLNKSVRKAFGRYLGYVLRNPLRIFKKVYMQSVMVIQPVDVMADGEQNMCDGCPDITVWKDPNGIDQLVWSCRLEEPMKYGRFLRTVPKEEMPGVVDSAVSKEAISKVKVSNN